MAASVSVVFELVPVVNPENREDDHHGYLLTQLLHILEWADATMSSEGAGGFVYEV